MPDNTNTDENEDWLNINELLAEYDKTGKLDPIVMAKLAQEIFENPTLEKLEILDRITEYVKAKKEISSIALTDAEGQERKRIIST